MTEILKPDPDALEWDPNSPREKAPELKEQELPDYDHSLFSQIHDAIVVEPIEGDILADD